MYGTFLLQAFAALKECVTSVSKGTAGLLTILASHEKFKPASGAVTALSKVGQEFYNVAASASAYAKSEVSGGELCG